MVRVYQLEVLVNGRPVKFSMDADSELSPSQKIDDATANKWRARLEAIAHSMFKENVVAK